MIKAIIFDYGNVISTVDNDRFLEEIAVAAGKTGSELNALIDANKDLLMQYESGQIASGIFFQEFRETIGLDMTQDEFVRLFTGRFQPIHETRDLVRKLKDSYTIGLLSNTNPWDFEYEIAQCDVFPLFDSVTVSFQAGAMKPDNAIYLDALKKLALGPEECVYIDDIKEYVDAAGRLGIQGVHYSSHAALMESLKDLRVSL